MVHLRITAPHIADELTLPFDSISLEMVFRGIYHFTQALNQGFTTNILAYLTAPQNRDLGIVKSPRLKRVQPPPYFSFLFSCDYPEK